MPSAAEQGARGSPPRAWQPVEKVRLTEDRPIPPTSNEPILTDPTGSTPVVSSDLNEIDSLLSKSTFSTDCWLRDLSLGRGGPRRSGTMRPAVDHRT